MPPWPALSYRPWPFDHNANYFITQPLLPFKKLHWLFVSILCRCRSLPKVSCVLPLGSFMRLLFCCFVTYTLVSHKELVLVVKMHLWTCIRRMVKMLFYRQLWSFLWLLRHVFFLQATFSFLSFFSLYWSNSTECIVSCWNVLYLQHHERYDNKLLLLLSLAITYRMKTFCTDVFRSEKKIHLTLTYLVTKTAWKLNNFRKSAISVNPFC